MRSVQAGTPSGTYSENKDQRLAPHSRGQGVLSSLFFRGLHALGLIRQYGLLPRDALHTAAALEIGIGTMISTDADFALVEELRLYTCNQRALQLLQAGG